MTLEEFFELLKEATRKDVLVWTMIPAASALYIHKVGRLPGFQAKVGDSSIIVFVQYARMGRPVVQIYVESEDGNYFVNTHPANGLNSTVRSRILHLYLFVRWYWMLYNKVSEMKNSI